MLILGAAFENDGDGKWEVFVTADAGSVVLIVSNWGMDSSFLWVVRRLSHEAKESKVDGHPTEDTCSRHHSTVGWFLLGVSFICA